MNSSTYLRMQWYVHTVCRELLCKNNSISSTRMVVLLPWYCDLMEPQMPSDSVI